MRWLLSPWLHLAFGSVLGLAAASCGADVTASDASTSSSSTSGALACAGSKPLCVTDCGAVDAPVNPTCADGVWACPSGSFDALGCMHDPPCPTEIAPCEVCDSAGVSCDLSPSCFSGCPAVACSTCSGPVTSGGCSCACDAAGQLACSPQLCCVTDADCGDKFLMPCVNGVCKTPVDGACWSTVECAPAGSCINAFVCPCGESCDAEDKPGFCEGPPP